MIIFFPFFDCGFNYINFGRVFKKSSGQWRLKSFILIDCNKVCRPMKEGRLDIRRLRLHNVALLGN